MRTAIVSLGRLEEFAAQAQVRRVSAPARLRPLLDLAGAATHLPAFRSARGWSGRNVIVGVVDTGIDAAHAMFGGASSRVLAIWDQTLPGTGAGPFPYGTLLGSGALAASLDADGHGTHVAGIAAGRLGTYEGPACDAQIIVVKTGFSSTEIQDGVDFIFQEATRLGRPAVVNLSLGGHGDPHDGSDDLDVFIDSVSGPGR
ncbi:MAG TPA: S8 family serine peptidase, partial [Verrucomicrobiota bacterium]|nr:S8 family serine peptidase [Verrucomicrobiota bacterium]